MALEKINAVNSGAINTFSFGNPGNLTQTNFDSVNAFSKAIGKAKSLQALSQDGSPAPNLGAATSDTSPNLNKLSAEIADLKPQKTSKVASDIGSGLSVAAGASNPSNLSTLSANASQTLDKSLSANPSILGSANSASNLNSSLSSELIDKLDNLLSKIGNINAPATT